MLIRTEFDVSFAALGLLVSMQSLGPLIATVPAGYVSDRFAPRVPLSLGALLAALGMAGAALAPGFGALLAAMLVNGLGAALIMTGGLTYTVRRADARQRGRFTSRVMTGVQVGAFLGPALGGLVASTLGWRMALVLPAAAAVVAGALTWRVIRAPLERRPITRTEPLSKFSLRLPRPVLAVAALGALLAAPVQGQRNVVLPLYGSAGLGLDAAGVGLAVSLANGARTLAIFFGGNVIDRLGRGTALLVMATCGAAAALVLLFPADLSRYALIGLLVALSGIGAVLPSVLIGDRSPREQIGRALGVLQSVGGAAGILGTAGAGFLLDSGGFGAVGVLLAAAFAVAGVIGLRIVRDARGTRSEDPAHD